jgi:signal peptidase II
MKYLSLGMPKAIFPGFDLELRFNHGAAFSFLADETGWQRWFFVVFAIAVSIMLYFWLRRLPRSQKIEGIGLSLMLGGALGNLVDRIFFGYVIDFISVYIQKPNWTWPAFNIADSAICVGVALVMFALLRKPEK